MLGCWDLTEVNAVWEIEKLFGLFIFTSRQHLVQQTFHNMRRLLVSRTPCTSSCCMGGPSKRVSQQIAANLIDTCVLHILLASALQLFRNPNGMETYPLPGHPCGCGGEPEGVLEWLTIPPLLKCMHFFFQVRYLMVKNFSLQVL